MARGQGRIFKIRKGRIWHCAFYDHGREVRMTTGTDNRDEALGFLRKKLDEVGRGSFVDDRRLRVRDLLDALVEDYRLNDRDARKLGYRIKRLRRRPDFDRLGTIAAKWRPWRSVAARILWHHYLSERRERALRT